MDNTVVRTVTAPTEAEARTEAGPLLDAFRAAGWELREALWIPGDRRPSLGESLLLSPENQLLLEANGTLQLTFFNADALAVAPAAVAAPRAVDSAEEIGGVRYRRLVPRFAIGIVIAVVGLIIFISFASSMPFGPFAARPTPDDEGMCPIGYVQGMKLGSDGQLTPDGTCEMFPQ